MALQQVNKIATPHQKIATTQCKLGATSGLVLVLFFPRTRESPESYLIMSMYMSVHVFTFPAMLAQ